MMARREDYGAREDGTPVELPDGVLVLTCGVDTQDDRLEYETVGFGHFGEKWGIRKAIIKGRPDTPEVWAQLDDAIDHVYRFKDGLGLKVSMTFIDEGGHFTQDVRLQTRQRIGKKVFCIKGYAGSDHPYTAPPRQVKILVDGKTVGRCWQYQLGVDSGKSMIMDDLSVKTPGPKYCHFPKRDDYGSKYFNGLLSERPVFNERTRKWSWQKIPGHERNEPLDCRNYALAAFKALPVNLDEIDRRLKAARMDRQTMSTDAESQKPTAAPAKRRQRNDFDEW